MQSKRKLKLIAHKSFEAGLLLKGIDGILEILGGILLLFMDPVRMSKLTRLLTQHELSEDPKDVIANYIAAFSKNFSVSTQHFGVLFLLSHGIIKCIMVILLYRKIIWTYPLMVISLVIFIGYQIYRYIIGHSVFLLALTMLDFIILILTVIEYKRIRITTNSKS